MSVEDETRLKKLLRVSSCGLQVKNLTAAQAERGALVFNS